MLTYEISVGADPSSFAVDDLWRVEFRAPIHGSQALIWIDNIPYAGAVSIYRDWRQHPENRQVFCRRCPLGDFAGEHEHDTLPEERGWLNSEIENIRLMPMREAV